MAELNACACGSGKRYARCCEPYIEGREIAPTAQALMRSRYVAYTMLREDYLLETWHGTTRPEELGLDEDVLTKWLGLEVKRFDQNEDSALVEFVARYKVGARAYRLHETSRFVREGGKWFYVDGALQ
jgi:SEC-C motif-containing protein